MDDETGRAPGSAPDITRPAWRRITGIFAFVLVVGIAACSSTAVLDEHLVGWQGEHDQQTHDFAHQSFALNRQLSSQADAVASSRALNWSHYAEPMLQTATRSRTVHEAQGRALVLERFLAHMHADPDVGATEEWFTGQVRAIEAEADAAAAETAAVTGTFAAPLAMGEDAFRGVAAAAAREGRVRGEALQLADLRRTAGNYFRRLGYDERTLAFDRGDGATPVPDEHLIAGVDRRLGWAALRQSILEPRTCTTVEARVHCAPVPAGTAPPVVAQDQEVVTPPPPRSILPGDTNRWSEPKVRAPDLLERRPGW